MVRSITHLRQPNRSLDSMPLRAMRTPMRENGLQRTAQDSDTLVTDPLGVQELAQGRERPAVALLSQAVLRGGRGLLSHERATTATTVMNDGFHAAERGPLLSPGMRPISSLIYWQTSRPGA
jgi:hypothetical protein